MPPGWFSRRRYGGPGAVLASVAVFGVLLCLAGHTIITSAALTSNACYGDGGQLTCPVRGPDWARPLPGAAAFLGLLAGFAGLLAGRPVRVPALAAGFLLTALGLAAGMLMSPA